MHKNARLTPYQREYIQKNPDGLSVTELTRRFKVSRMTIYKWKKAGRIEDAGSGGGDKLRKLKDWQEWLIVELRKSYWLNLDELHLLGRECLKWEVSREPVRNILKKHGVRRKPGSKKKWGVFKESGSVAKIVSKEYGPPSPYKSNLFSFPHF